MSGITVRLISGRRVRSHRMDGLGALSLVNVQWAIRDGGDGGHITIPRRRNRTVTIPLGQVESVEVRP